MPDPTRTPADWRSTVGGRIAVQIDALRSAVASLVDVLPFGPLQDDGFCRICARYDGHAADCEWEILALLAGEGTAQPQPPWAGNDVTGSTLLLGVWFPNCPPDTDPEIVADCVAVILNEERARNGGTEGAVEIAGIPAPQWLTPETLANLKRAASGEGTTQPDPDDGWIEVTPDALARACDRAHASPNAAEVGHREGFCLACAELRVAMSGERGAAPQVPAAAVRELIEAHDAVEEGLVSFDLHNAAVTRLEAAWAAVRVVAADGAPQEGDE